MSDIVRVFLSIDIKDADLLSQIMGVQSKLDVESAKMKLVEQENIHYTIRFFGDTQLSRIQDIKTCLEQIKFDPFDIEIFGVGAFPNKYRPRVIWIGAGLNGDFITDLKVRIDESIRELGYHPEKQKFTPHATIARVRYVKNVSRLSENLDELAEESIGKMRISHVTMKKSTLTPSGPIYEDLWHVPEL